MDCRPRENPTRVRAIGALTPPIAPAQSHYLGWLATHACSCKIRVTKTREICLKCPKILRARLPPRQHDNVPARDCKRLRQLQRGMRHGPGLNTFARVDNTAFSGSLQQDSNAFVVGRRCGCSFVATCVSFCFSVGSSVCGRFGCSSTISPLLFYLIFRLNPADACIKCSKIARAARRFAKAKKRTFTAEKWRFCLEGITRGRQY